MLRELTEDIDLPADEPERLEDAREWRDELLQPEIWTEVLEPYARAMRVAVALTNLEGIRWGPCHNPQPIWQLARGTKPETAGQCPFCLTPSIPCRAVADAIRTGGVVMVEDGAGLAHVAVPLSLGGQPLGALIAGQVLSRYPEPLRLQRVAREFGISQQDLWQVATRQVPLKTATLQVYGELLMLLGQSYVGTGYAAILHRNLVLKNQKIRRSLQEKDVLLHEIHHRVKNNLQIISSLLNMQLARFDDLNDASAREALQGSQQRIAIMAQIHDLLYGDEHVGNIELGDYIKNLVEIALSFSQSRGTTRIQSQFDLTPAMIGMRQAIPCGLIVNELVTNVVKYAFPNREEGKIRIRVAPVMGNRVLLAISDDGVGFPEGLDLKRSDSLGLQIIGILVKQIGGTFQLDTQGGVSMTVEFPGGT